MTPASSLKLTKNNISGSSGFNFLDSGSTYFKVNDGGPVEIRNTRLKVSGAHSVNVGNSNIEARNVTFDKSNNPQNSWHDMFTANNRCLGEALVGLADGSNTDVTAVYKVYWSVSGNGSKSSSITQHGNSGNGNGLQLQWNGNTLQVSPESEYANKVSIQVKNSSNDVTWHI